jgi:long-chain fatty acid transport protein
MKKIVLLCALLAPGLAMAQGFQLNLQGTKQIAMGQGGAGWASDAATVFLNPGAVAFLEKNSVQAGVSPTGVRTTYRSPGASQVKANNKEIFVYPFHLMAAWGPKEAKWKAGISVVTPFGSTLEYPEDWTGKYSLQRITLQTISVQPTFSYKLTEKLGIGAGASFTFGNVELQRATPGVAFSDGTPGDVALSGTGNGINFNAGLFYQLTPKLSLGASYRSSFKIELEDGDVEVNVPNSLITSGRFITNNTFNSSVTLPATISLGGAYKANDKLTLIADFNYVTWNVYEKLEFDFKTDITNDPNSAFRDDILERNYEDSYSAKVGAEFMVTPKFATRAGVAYGVTPVQDGYLNPDGADANRVNLSAGVGYTFGEHLVIDAAFLYVRLEERTTGSIQRNFYGTWKTQTFVPSIQVAYQF